MGICTSPNQCCPACATGAQQPGTCSGSQTCCSQCKTIACVSDGCNGVCPEGCTTHAQDIDCGRTSCTNECRNGDETDIDCGGSCSKCINGKICRQSSDCQSNYCNPNKIC